MAKILAVEDSKLMLQIVSLTLSNAGYEVAKAENGEEGLALAKDSEFDLVISDLHMPKLDGIGLVTELRKLDNYANKPILLLTTESETDTKMAGKNAGASGWIVKPVDPEALLETVVTVLR